MSELTKQALKVDNNQSFPNNNAGLITPTALRTFNENMIDSLVDEIGYTADSASFDNRIDALSGSVAVNTGSFLITASAVDNVMTFTKGDSSTFNVTVGSVIPAGTISGSQQITALGFVSSSITGSSLVTASFAAQTLTFTKGDGSQFGIFIPDNSGSVLPSGVVSGSSQINYPQISNIPSGIVSGAAQVTPLLPSGVVSGSSQVSYTGLSNIPAGIVSGSSQIILQDTTGLLSGSRIDGLVPSASFAITASFALNAVIETGSFATTGSNVFIGNQTITGSLLISGSEVLTGPLTASSLQINGITDLNGTIDVSNDATFRGNVLIQSSGEQKLLMRSTSGGGVSQGFDLLIQTSSFIIRDETHDIDFLEFDYISSSADHILKLEANRFEMNSGSLGISGSLTASLQEGYAWVGDSSGRTQAIPTSSFGTPINTGSFATTGSNTFVGNQVISGSTTITGELSITPALLPNGFPAGLGQFIIPFLSGSTNVIARDSDNALYWQPAFNVLAVSASTGNVTTSPTGMTVTSNTTGSTQITTTRLVSNFGAGRNIAIAGDAESTALTGLTGITNPSIILQSGSAGLPPQYYAPIQFQASQSFTDGRVTITRPLVGLEGAQITGSVDITGTITASLQEGFVLVGNSAGRTTTVATSSFGGGTDISSLNAFTASQQALNTTFATTGSNTFTGLQTINNTLEIGDGVGTPVQLYATALTDYNLFVNKDLRLQGTLSASLQEGYVWVGDSSGRTTTVPTSSFGGGGSTDTGSLMVTGSVAGNVLTFTKGDASTFVLTVDTGSGGGGAAFPFTGSAEITGSLGITGSMSGFVNTLSVASSTASVNFNDGNMFTLTLPTGSTTHITPSNIRRGQTINIQISQASGASTGSVSFSPNVLFAGGNDYQVTATGSAIDLLTFVSLDGTNVLGTSIKNFL
jgi:hypothetical protein